MNPKWKRQDKYLIVKRNIESNPHFIDIKTTESSDL